MKSTKIALFFTLFAFGCSGGGQNTNDAGNGNDSGSGTDGSGNDGSTTSSKPNAGFVSFAQSKTGNTDSFTATAGFIAVSDAGTSSSGCSGMQAGSCCYIPPSTGTDGGTTTPTPVSAGAVTLKDGTATLATMTPSGTSYTAVSNPPTTALMWNAGDTLDVSAAGNTVHAFSGSVTAVSALAGVSPALSLVTPVVITRSTDFNMAWTSGTGSIQLVVAALKGTSSDGVITCSSATDMGSISVPTALLQKLSAGDTGIVSLSRTITADASPDNATVTLSSATTTSGTATFN